MSKCWKCNYQFYDHTCLTGDYEPRAGDYTCCIDCGTIGKFDVNLDLIPLSIPMLEELKEKDVQVWKLLTRSSEIIKEERQNFKERKEASSDQT